MKKTLVLILVAIMIFAFSGCRDDSDLASSSSVMAMLTDTDIDAPLDSTASDMESDISETPSQNLGETSKPDKTSTAQTTASSIDIPEHSHKWLESKSTCVSPRTCNICNAKIGDHKYDSKGKCVYCSEVNGSYNSNGNITSTPQEPEDVEITGLGNVLIFGDSYSTFEGYIPSGYATFYSSGGGATDVRNVSETWWHQVISETGSNLLLNNSLSGSPIGYTGYNKLDCSKTTSFIYRLRQLGNKFYFSKNRVDTVFVFGGTNDSWAGAPLGSPKYEGWTEQDLYNVLPAISYFLNTLKINVPNAKIYCLINTELKQEITSVMQESCERYGITAITFDTIDKVSGHPTIKGMKEIKDRVLEVVEIY